VRAGAHAIARGWVLGEHPNPASDRQVTRAPAAERLARFDALVEWKGPKGTVRYLIQEKKHLQNQDVRVGIDQLKRWQDQLGRAERGTRLLLVAPIVRPPHP
jgi:hypothetical protein